MNDTATQQGAARQEPPTRDPDLKDGEVVVHRSARDIALEAMAERQEKERVDELNEAIAHDPGLADEQRRIDGAIRQANAEAGINHEEAIPVFGNDGAAVVRPMHQPQPEPSNLPRNLQDDPLADFIEMRNGAPMVKAKVNGEDRLIPLADAKRQLQIGTAAEVRMQTAARYEQVVKDREARLSAGEAALSARMRAQAKPLVPAQPDLTEEDLLEEAKDIFSTAFSGTEEEAAIKLAKTLAKIKRTATPVAQSIDSDAVASKAASMVYGKLTAESKKKDVATGFKAFKSDYPDIIGDTQLFKMADDMTDTIEKQHPDWNASQIMDEAGKRTRAWVKHLSGKTDDTGNAPSRPPGSENSPVVTLDTQSRQERKAGLVRMPSPAAGAQYHEPDPVNESEQSPQDAFLQLKAARGQPV